MAKERLASRAVDLQFLLTFISTFTQEAWQL